MSDKKEPQKEYLGYDTYIDYRDGLFVLENGYDSVTIRLDDKQVEHLIDYYEALRGKRL